MQTRSYCSVMQQIKDMAAEKTLMERELIELKTAAQAIVDMVDPPKTVQSK